MNYHVNDSCIGCGLCVSICPQVFQLNDEGVATAVQAADANSQPAADQAMNDCPVAAIETA